MGGRHIKLSELLLGFEGLALLRGLVDAPDDEMQARLDEIRNIAANLDSQPWSSGLDVAELDPVAGYEHWSGTYDTVNNPLLVMEQPVVERLLEDAPPGDALDAACGTGRHAIHLARRHRVTGVDGSPHMLAVARQAVPEGRFVRGDLSRLPLPDGRFDVVTCALALCHVSDLAEAVGELARVARRGARLVLSDPHPLSVAIISQAFFPTPEGGMAFVRNHFHPIGRWIDAFGRGGLRLMRCEEPLWEEQHLGGLAQRFIPGAERQALVGLPSAIVWELTKEG